MKKSLLAGMLIPLLMALVSCSTQMPELPWTEHEVSGIEFRVRPASRESLIEAFGNPSIVMNPLLDYPSLLQQRELFVLDVEVSSPELEIEIITRETTLVYVNEEMKMKVLLDPETVALDAKHLQDAWKVYMDNYGKSDIPEMMDKTYRALPGNLVAKPGEPARGYLVFLRRFPKSGTAELSLAVRASNGDTGTIPISIEIPDLSKSNRNAEGEENSGIFADNDEE